MKNFPRTCSVEEATAVAPADWAMCAGPINYRWGGTWIAAYKGTKNPNAAKEMIKYIATDDTYLEEYVFDFDGGKAPEPQSHATWWATSTCKTR